MSQREEGPSRLSLQVTNRRQDTDKQLGIYIRYLPMGNVLIHKNEPATVESLGLQRSCACAKNSPVELM